MQMDQETQVSLALYSIPAEHARNYFHHCGYTENHSLAEN